MPSGAVVLHGPVRHEREISISWHSVMEAIAENQSDSLRHLLFEARFLIP